MDEFGDPVPPDTSQPWCIAGGLPASSAGTTVSVGDNATAPTYGVRVWEEVSAANFVEITANCPAPGCNQTAPDGQRVRLTVQLPARPSPDLLGNPRAQRKFWVMPVVKTLVDLRPDTSGPFSELAAGGVIVTGESLGAPVRRCGLALGNVVGRWRCTAKRTATTFNALKAASFKPTNVDPSTITADFAVSIDGVTPTAPANHPNPRRFASFAQWSTAEPTGL